MRLQPILALEPLGPDRFRGISVDPGWNRVFGGQVIAQALMAAARTVDPARPVHSLHAYFLLAGDPSQPIVFDVDRIRDGGSFTTRRVLATQGERTIFALSASFHVREGGPGHEEPMPDVPLPEDLPDEATATLRVEAEADETIRRYWGRLMPMELRPVDLGAFIDRSGHPRRQCYWLKTREPLSDDPLMHTAAIAFMSDFTLLDTALSARGFSAFSPELQVVSLDHAVWFHAPARPDEWMLYMIDSPWSGGSRGFARGMLHARDGRLIASVAQEGLMRLRTR